MTAMAAITSSTLAFHGAARTVTGSRYLLEHRGVRTVVDAGLFQGFKELRELNWREPPFPPHTVRRVLLTHAHIDHSGALPLLARQGFFGEVFATRSTIKLARLLLLDAAEIEEEHARYAEKKGYSRHRPALPLFTVRDATEVLKKLEPVAWNTWLDLGDGLRARWLGAGHILGAASIELRLDRGGRETGLVMSGDIGRYGVPLHRDPEPRPDCDVLVCESTYGNRDHESMDAIEEQLCRALRETFDREGIVLVPAFAVGRAQQITLLLSRLFEAGRLPAVPVHIDSPMAIEATEIYSSHLDQEHVDEDVFADGRERLFPEGVELHRSVEQSKQLNDLPGPRVIISASGMLTAGRVLHHLRRIIGNPRHLVLLVGFQAPGTRGRQLLEGQPHIRMYGEDYAVRCRSVAVHGLSAHADRGELLRWIRSAPSLPEQIYLTHGEPESAFAFQQLLERELGVAVSVEVPEMGEAVTLGER
jgi:metallo-beta-lactamase family protein